MRLWLLLLLCAGLVQQPTQAWAAGAPDAQHTQHIKQASGQAPARGRSSPADAPCSPAGPENLDALCGAAYAPVCGKDGVTYASVCHLQLSCADYGHAGECGGAGLGVSLPNFEFTPRLGMLYLCLAVLGFVTLILDHLAVPR